MMKPQPPENPESNKEHSHRGKFLIPRPHTTGSIQGTGLQLIEKPFLGQSRACVPGVIELSAQPMRCLNQSPHLPKVLLAVWTPFQVRLEIQPPGW